MNLPAIWQTPVANHRYLKNDTRPYKDGDTVSPAISYSFLRDPFLVEYIKGVTPPGMVPTQTGITGTMSPAVAGEPTLPRDYQITVRAWTKATPYEKTTGLPAEWYEDRTFTIVGGLWLSPPAGALTKSDGTPYKRGDQVGGSSLGIPFAFDPTRVPTLELIGGTLPPGVIFSTASRRLVGTVAALPKGVNSYPLLFRATYDNRFFQDRSFNFVVDPFDERHGWNTEWLDDQLTSGTHQDVTYYNLGTIRRGTHVEIQLRVDNPDNDPLEYKATGVAVPLTGQVWVEGLPKGLRITNEGKIVGTPIIAENQPGSYFFRVYARDPNDSEGTPRTSELTFRLVLESSIVLEQQLNDTVKWITPEGSLGQTYETFASHFTIEAVPQYNLVKLNNEFQAVHYTLIGNNPLPLGVKLEEHTGHIVGVMPHFPTDTRFRIRVRARVVFTNRVTGVTRESSAYSDRDFSFTVKNLYYTDSVANLHIGVPPFDRREIAKWIYGTNLEKRASGPHSNPAEATSQNASLHNHSHGNVMTHLGPEILFRRDDVNWGRIERPSILLLAGMVNPTPSQMHKMLMDYHKPLELRFGELKWAKGVDPAGNYVYDVLYISVTDPMHGAGGFTTSGEQALPFPGHAANAVPYTGDPRYKNKRYTKPVHKHNIRPSNDGSTYTYHAMSLANARNDFLREGAEGSASRIAWNENPRGAELAQNRGLGIKGKEGLPFWMTCEQVKGRKTSVIGYVPAIELAYLKPFKGAQAVKTLVQAGFQKLLQGRPIKVDRYLLLTEDLTMVQFDMNFMDGSVTTFDGPDLDPPTAAYTTFDATARPISKYYKFPPGDA